MFVLPEGNSHVLRKSIENPIGLSKSGSCWPLCPTIFPQMAAAEVSATQNLAKLWPRKPGAWSANVQLVWFDSRMIKTVGRFGEIGKTAIVKNYSNDIISVPVIHWSMLISLCFKVPSYVVQILGNAVCKHRKPWQATFPVFLPA